MRTNGRPSSVAVTIDALRRHARIGVVRSGCGGAAPRVFSPDRRADVGSDDVVVARVYHADDLLDIHLAGDLTGLNWIVGSLLDVIRRAAAQRSQPGAPASVLLHGPPGVAIPVVVHALTVRLEAELVQLFASAVLPNSSSGSQPIVAPAVNQARGRRSSVLYIDELEALVTDDRRDIRRQRALNDLLGEALRFTYGPAPVVIAGYTGHDDPPPVLSNRFGHVRRVADREHVEHEVAMSRAVNRPVRMAPRHLGQSTGAEHANVD